MRTLLLVVSFASICVSSACEEFDPPEACAEVQIEVNGRIVPDAEFAVIPMGTPVRVRMLKYDESGERISGRKSWWTTRHPSILAVTPSEGDSTQIKISTREVAILEAHCDLEERAIQIAAEGAIGVAAKLLPDRRAAINPLMLSPLDTTKELWLAGDLNEFLGYQEETAHRALRPAGRYKLSRGPDGWFETQVQVAGMLFTVVQFDQQGKRVWPDFRSRDNWQGVWRGIAGERPQAVGIRLTSPSYPEVLYDSWIRICNAGARRYLELDSAVIPVDRTQLDVGAAWILIGDWVEWASSHGVSPQVSTSGKLRYDITAVPRMVNTAANRANVQARTITPTNGPIWGRFGWLGTGELWGYRHPLVLWDASRLSGSIDLSPQGAGEC